MELIIHPGIARAYPGLKVAVMEVILPSSPELGPGIMEAKGRLEDRMRKGPVPEGPERLAKYNAFYRRFGSRAPMEFQAKSIAGGSEIPASNPIVTCMFMAELKNLVLTAGHDVAALGTTIEVLCSEGGEEYTRINGKQQSLKRRDVFARDGRGIISSVLYGPDSRTRITASTRNCLFMCYCFGMDDADIRSHMGDIVGYLRLASGGGLRTGGVSIV
jgi:DNA/RNA-binding domain of Phe-tRNA-synthetase-like protein